MSTYLIISVTLHYAWVAYDLWFIRKDMGNGLIFFGYTVANIGFLIALRRAG